MQSTWTFDSDAILSDDRRYRYALGRRLTTAENPRRLTFVMLNPSTADEIENDHTIRKCLGFAKRLGCDRIDVVNLFAWMSKSPPDLIKVEDPYGDPMNLKTILAVAKASKVVLAAWGGPWSGALKRIVAARADQIQRELAAAAVELQCLGVTQDGCPRHPLMLPYKSRPMPWVSKRVG